MNTATKRIRILYMTEALRDAAKAAGIPPQQLGTWYKMACQMADAGYGEVAR
jgi:hypothetical protein